MSDLASLFASECQDHSMQNQIIPNSSIIIERPTQLQQTLPSEPQNGNVEYKYQLETTNGTRLQHLTSQLNWRLKEGNGQAIYEIGVMDDGKMVGLSRNQMHKSISTLSHMANELGASITILRERIISKSSSGQPPLACQVLVQKNQVQQKELRVAALGNTSAGKSTLIGVLTNGELDDGAGQSRMILFRHRHEIQSGQTSSVSQEILGFDQYGKALNYSGNIAFPQEDDKSMVYHSFHQQGHSPEEICQHASNIVQFIDLAGNEKYLKTTVSGLIGNLPHVALLVINASTNLDLGTTMEHLSLLLALQLSFWIVINKIDLISLERLEQLKQQIRAKLPQRSIVEINTVEQAKEFSSKQCSKYSVAMISVSCTKGIRLQILYSLLFGQFQRPVEQKTPLAKSAWTKFYVEKVFHDHSVVGGVLVSGQICVGDQVLIGPDSKGVFHPTRIISLQKHKTRKLFFLAGESGTIGLEKNFQQPTFLSLRKGMVLLPMANDLEMHLAQKHVCTYFKAKLKCGKGSNWIRNGFQATFYSNHIRQNVEIVKILGKKSKRSAVVLVKFVKQPEFMNICDMFLLKEGPNKTVGKVVQLFPLQTNLY